MLLDFVYYAQGLGEIGVKSGLGVEGSVAVGGVFIVVFHQLGIGADLSLAAGSRIGGKPSTKCVLATTGLVQQTV